MEYLLMGYIDVRPVFIMAAFGLISGLTFLVVSILASVRKGIAASAVAGVVVFGVGVFILYGPMVGYTQTRTFDMLWSVEADEGPPVDEPKVSFTFSDYPDHWIWIESQQLADHLETAGVPEIEVEFEVTLDYGEVRGFNPVRIGSLKDWGGSVSGAGSRVSGSGEKPSPWD